MRWQLRPEAPATEFHVLDVTLEKDGERVEVKLPDGHRVLVYPDAVRVGKPKRPSTRRLWTSRPS